MLFTVEQGRKMDALVTKAYLNTPGLGKRLTQEERDIVKKMLDDGIDLMMVKAARRAVRTGWYEPWWVRLRSWIRGNS